MAQIYLESCKNVFIKYKNGLILLKGLALRNF